MPICASSIPNGCRTLGLALLLGAMTSPASGQAPAGSSETAKPGLQAADSAEMERLKAAMARRGSGDPEGPTALPSLPDSMRKRAFEGLHKRKTEPDIQKRARAARADAARQLEADRDAMQARLYQALGLAPPATSDVAPQARPGPGDTGGKASFVPVLFVSSSMPVTTLRTYAAQIERVQGVLAFRGIPGGLGKIGPMAKLSAEILRIDPGCEGPECAMRNVQLIVDPILFRQHGVKTVPALAMIPGDPTKPYCERDDESGPAASHIVFGDAALSGLLEEYRRLGGAREVHDAETSLSRR